MASWVQLIVTGITMGSMYALIGLGYVTIYRTSRVVNMAQGSFVMIGGLFTYTIFDQAGLPYWPAALLAVIAVVVISVAVYVVVLKQMMKASMINVILATIGLALLFEGAALVTYGSYGKSFPAFLPSAEVLHFKGVAVDPQSLWTIGLMFAIFVGLHILGTRTRVGKEMTATATDPGAARMSGINTTRMIILAFVISGVIGAIGGIAIAPMISVSYQSGLIFGLVGMVGAILGGWGSSGGAVLGGLAIGIIQSVTTGLLPTGWQTAVTFGVLILILYFRPQGLLGTTMTEGEA